MTGSDFPITGKDVQYPGLTIIGYCTGQIARQIALLEILHIDRSFTGQARRRFIQLTSPDFASRILPVGDTPRPRRMSRQLPLINGRGQAGIGDVLDWPFSASRFHSKRGLMIKNSETKRPQRQSGPLPVKSANRLLGKIDQKYTRRQSAEDDGSGVQGSFYLSSSWLQYL